LTAEELSFAPTIGGDRVTIHKRDSTSGFGFTKMTVGPERLGETRRWGSDVRIAPGARKPAP
jgi:hypothetical protein